MLKLTGRYYRPIPLDNPGYQQEPLELDPQRTALVAMHCWNIGGDDGPAVDGNFFVGMGSLEAHREAARLIRDCIRPAMDAARQAKVLVCHVECEEIARKYPGARWDHPSAGPPAQAESPVVPGWRKKMEDRFHGKDYREKSPIARMDRAAEVAPRGGEPLVQQTEQMHQVLCRRGIENLIYTGFATDMCVLRAPGGVEWMAPRGYRMFLMRDATLGVECSDTFAERIATRWAIRYFETHYGDTIQLPDFLTACQLCH